MKTRDPATRRATLGAEPAIGAWLSEEGGGGDRDNPPGLPSEPERVPKTSGRTVLLAEDDDLVRSMMAAGLEDAGFEVFEVCDGLEALAFMERGETEVAALVSDIRMPGMDGLELTRTVAHSWPRVAIVLVSGYPPGGRMIDVPEAAFFVSKPFRPDELANAVGRALAHRRGH